MNFELDELYLDIQKEALQLSQSIEDIAVEADASNVIHPGILKALRNSNLSDLMVPKQYGGRFEKIDPLAICLVREAMMASSAHLDSIFALQGIGSYAVTMGGSEAQKQNWLPKIATTEILPALALTEPDAGSDLKSITTTITEHNDKLIINGEKAFISNAGAASVYVVFAKEDIGFSVVLVPANAKGVTIKQTPELIAPHALGDVRFDKVELPASERLGEPGKGLDLILATLGVFRVSVAGAAVGLAQAALDEAVRHTNSRIQFGRPLAKLGAVAQMLGDSWTEIEMCRLLTYRAATYAQHDPGSTLHHSSMAKLAASEMASRVVDRCVQMMGRFGLIHNSKIEKLYRQARPMRIYEGSSEILRLGIAKELAYTIT